MVRVNIKCSLFPLFSWCLRTNWTRERRCFENLFVQRRESVKGASAIPSMATNKMMQQNRQNSHHLRENESAKHIGEQSETSRMNAHCASHLKRSTEIVAGEDFLNCHTLAAVLEKVPAVSNDRFCSSQMPMMCQAQDHQSDWRLINNAYQIDSIGYNPLDSLEGRVDSISPTTSKNGLIQHGSSPAGLPFLLAAGVQSLSENGYPVGPMRNIMGMTNVAIEDASCGPIAPNRLGSQTAFLRQSSSPAGLTSQLSPDMDLPEIAEKPNIPMMKSTAEMRARNKSGMQTRISFVARKQEREFKEKMMPDLSLPESQKRDPGNHGASALINHLFSLPKSTNPELAAMNLIQDSVPCKIRAKRGFATHPRSIAERVRRTRISERMRKLQQLVPNMDQQTSTADMLDEAAKYIKLLQKQVQELSMNRSEVNGSCKCNSDPTGKV